MYRRTHKWFCLIFILILFGCAKEGEETRGILSKSALREQETAQTNTPSNDKQLEIIDRKIIKNGNIEFQTTSISETRTRINEAINKCDSYISSEDESTYNDRIQQRIVIKVPADKFDFLVSEITKGVKKFDQKHIEARDVTEEFLDITLRLSIKKETEKRYLQLLSKANTVKDILSIEKQVNELRSEIESIEGRLKYLENQIAYSTLTITFYEIVSTPVGFSNKFTLGLKNGWNNFVWFLVGIVNIWPFLLLGLIGIIGIRQYTKRKKK
ncbi:MAG: DUF4349 domain-containing protein [Desulfobacterales bacterium]|nr:DUF4349 domain-containing protein [Desulfobacterales bacterium]